MTTTTIPEPNITNLVDAFTYSNTVTGGTGLNYLLIGIWIILFLISKGMGSDKGIVTASFVCALIAFALATAGFVSFSFVLVFGLLTAMGALLSI
jgi:hypothetical protein